MDKKLIRVLALALAVGVVAIIGVQIASNMQTQASLRQRLDPQGASVKDGFEEERQRYRDYAEGMCAKIYNNADRYYREVDGNAMRFSDKERKHLMERFDIVRQLLAAKAKADDKAADAKVRAEAIRQLEEIGQAHRASLTNEQLDWWRAAISQ